MKYRAFQHVIAICKNTDEVKLARVFAVQGVAYVMYIMWVQNKALHQHFETGLVESSGYIVGLYQKIKEMCTYFCFIHRVISKH